MNNRSGAYLGSMRPEELLTPTPAGLCCPPGSFHVDPVRPVARALITHAHSDHARPGHGAVLATAETLDLMRLRYGDNFAVSVQPIRYGEPVRLDRVTVSLHPAGHVLGSAQILIEANGLRVVASGDYKNVADPTCRPFEPSAAMFSSPKQLSGFRCSVTATRGRRSRSSCGRSACFPSART